MNGQLYKSTFILQLSLFYFVSLLSCTCYGQDGTMKLSPLFEQLLSNGTDPLPNIMLKWVNNLEGIAAIQSQSFTASYENFLRVRRKEAIKAALIQQAESSQKDAIKILENSQHPDGTRITYISFWIVNGLFIAEPPRSVVIEILKLPFSAIIEARQAFLAEIIRDRDARSVQYSGHGNNKYHYNATHRPHNQNHPQHVSNANHYVDHSTTPLPTEETSTSIVSPIPTYEEVFIVTEPQIEYVYNVSSQPRLTLEQVYEYEPPTVPTTTATTTTTITTTTTNTPTTTTPSPTPTRQEYTYVENKSIFNKNPDPTHANWNIKKIRANLAWKYGADGRGVTVGHIDTGVLANHETLKDNFRSDHGWLAPYPYQQSEKPYSVDPHGTHTLGTMCGQNGIGVAPRAQWISCIGCDTISCPEEALLKCGQFIACPTLPDGTDADCSLTPQVVSNSWALNNGADTLLFNDVITLWRLFDIIPVFAIGNSGPTCSSANSPGDNDNVIGVGAVGIDDTMPFWSSRGPSPDSFFPVNRLKPDISAPGINVTSAWNDRVDGYGTISGTSMATPHVAGAIAILLSVYPDLTYDEVKQRLEEGAKRFPYFTTICGSSGEGANQFVGGFPNNAMGHGRLDVLKSLGIESKKISQNYHFI